MCSVKLCTKNTCTRTICKNLLLRQTLQGSFLVRRPSGTGRRRMRRGTKNPLPLISFNLKGIVQVGICMMYIQRLRGQKVIKPLKQCYRQIERQRERWLQLRLGQKSVMPSLTYELSNWIDMEKASCKVAVFFGERREREAIA